MIKNCLTRHLILAASNKYNEKFSQECAEFLAQQINSSPEFMRFPFYILSFLLNSIFYIFGSSSLKYLKKVRLFKDYLDAMESLINFFKYSDNLKIEEVPIKSFTIQNDDIMDCCVIGSGPGGATTAKHLVDSQYKVLWMEEGNYFKYSNKSIFTKTELENKYRSRGVTAALGNIPISYVEGRCVGGGSEVNSALYHRTPDAILNEWQAQYNVECIAPQDMEPHFIKNEEEVNVRLAPKSSISKASLKLKLGADNLNWKSQEVPRCYKYKNGDNVAEDIKQSMTQTFVPYALEKGAILKSGVKVTHLSKELGCWNIHTNKGIFKARNVFLCAGAIQTPYILLGSGISENIGQQLFMHPTFKAVARFNEDVNPGFSVPVHQVKEFAPSLSFGCSISALPHLAIALQDAPDALKEIEEISNQCAIYYGMIRPEGVGKIKRIPGFQSPLVTYSLTEKDRALLVDGYAKLLELIKAAGATNVYPCIKGWQDENYLGGNYAINPKNMRLMTIHLFSSCPMGENKRRCAVNSYGKVHGVEGLYINDASIIPTALGCNPQGTIMALARRNILHFMGKL